MAQIGSFTRGESGVYTGEIRTLTLRVKATIRPCERDNEKALTIVSAPAASSSARPGRRRRAKPARSI